MPLADKLKNLKATPKRTGPLWRGPEQDGITFSLLSRFLCCRERFRLLVVDGLRPERGWNHRTGYGDMWHVCEEYESNSQLGAGAWEQPLKDYAESLLEQYPMEQEHVAKWYEVCKLQFPLYVDYWAKHPDTVARKPLLSEAVFDVSYALPSGRKVRLRGKWDSVDLVIGNGRPKIWLQENKTKGDVDERQIVRQLTFDLQTMMYLVALRGHRSKQQRKMGANALPKEPIAGVRYNVVRRPLSGGKGTIVQKKGSKNVPAETADQYYARLAEYIRSEPETYFFRWNVEITDGDIDRFRRECLDPILEDLVEWWDWISSGKLWGPRHYIFPFGTFSSMINGTVGDLDECVFSGSTAGLIRVDTLFRELE